MKQTLFFLFLFISFVVDAQQNNSEDSIYCQLRDLLAFETKVDISHDCIDVIAINEILTNNCNLSQSFGVYAFSSKFIADDILHYLIKYQNNYFVFSAKDPMLITNKLLEIQEKFADEINLELVVKYIRKIGATPAGNMTNYMVISKKIGNLEYIYVLGRYK
jgi:hypothetical protein